MSPRRFAEKDTYEEIEDQVEDQLDGSPDDKPPRDDRSNDTVQTDDPDIDGDPDTSEDRDLSMNFKDIGGSVAQKWASQHPNPPGQPTPTVAEPHDLDRDQLADIVATAVEWLTDSYINRVSQSNPDMAYRVALDQAIHLTQGGTFYRSVDTSTYKVLLSALRNAYGSQ
jgi:hypothetical protein